MASTSASSSTQKRFKYDVFLSFRAEDTVKNFVDNLYHALVNKGIITYKDDEKIDKGESISEQQLIKSIEESRFYIIIFSKNYASSSWCLDELVKIMECHKIMDEQTAFPIFYDVDPTQVNNQSGVVGEALAFIEPFTRRRKRMLVDVDLEEEDDAGRWRDALKDAAGLAGWELKNTVDGSEAKLIEEIVEEILPKVLKISFSEKLVGMETRVKDVLSTLQLESDDVRMIGIKGIRGGGKTTLARAVFDHISSQFEGKSFVENVREVSEGTISGLEKLQNQVLQDLLNDQTIDVTSVSDGKNKMKKMMGSRKALVVLDDVNHTNQLEILAGKHNLFNAGSRIIVTTRDAQVFMAHKVKFIHDARQGNFIHDVHLLSHEEALCLFSRYAFGREIPIQGYEDLSRKVVDCACGLPLTIKIFGSYLHGKTEWEWEDAIERLELLMNKNLPGLEISYNGLDNDQKDIFLDVACILKGKKRKKAIRILESCGFNAELGLTVLEQKSLLSISSAGRLLLHDRIEEMGKNIVRRMHPFEPSRHNRLWDKREIEAVLVNESGTEATRSIKLKYTDLHPVIIMKGLKNMRKLRFLYVEFGYSEQIVDKVSQYLPDSLQSLYWYNYPFRCLPTTFRANKLVNLVVKRSNICQLWEGEGKVLNKLRFLSIGFSKLRSFDLRLTPHLERLDLRGCHDFVELLMLVECPKLKFLNLSGSRLSYLNLGMTPNLEVLYLEECNDFVELHIPVGCPKLKIFSLRGSNVSNLNPGPLLKKLESLEKLTLSIKDITHLPDSIYLLKHMKYLELTSWSLEQLPNDLDRLECLEELHITDCISLLDIPNSIFNMKCLKCLHLPHCILVKKLPEELGRLHCLKELNIEGTGITHLPQSIFQLKGLCIVWSRGRLELHGFTSLKIISRYTASCYI